MGELKELLETQTEALSILSRLEKSSLKYLERIKRSMETLHPELRKSVRLAARQVAEVVKKSREMKIEVQLDIALLESKPPKSCLKGGRK